MRPLKNMTFVLLLIFLLSGCTAMFVPATKDPSKKLDDAFYLFQQANRPLPAEKLIRESIEIYKKTNDEKGLMKAYWTYGVFLSSEAVGNLKGLYEKDGFLEETIKFKNRYEGSITFYKKAEKIAKQYNDTNYLATIMFNMAESYQLDGEAEQGCEAFKTSLDLNREYHLANPKIQFYLPGTGYSSFEEYEKVFIEYMNSKGCR